MLSNRLIAEGKFPSDRFCFVAMAVEFESRCGNMHMKNDVTKSKKDISNIPNHHAPSHRGSVGGKGGGLRGWMYRRVQSDPKINPVTGPRIRTPIVIAMEIKFYYFHGNKKILE